MEEIKARHEKALNCPICYNVFTDPIQMTCGHTYCRNCLKEFINSRKRDLRGYQLIDCALCRKTSRVNEISMNVNYVVKATTDIYKHLLTMKYIKCNACNCNMDISTRFFYCETCRQASSNLDELANIICGACGLVNHKEHNVKELQKASENDKRKRRAKINRELNWSRSKLLDLDESMESFMGKVQQIRDSIQAEINKQEALDARFDESVMFQKTLDQMAVESKNQSRSNCRWIQIFKKQLSDMERRLPNAPPAGGDADIVTLSDDEAREEEQEDLDEEGSSNDSFAEPPPATLKPKIERSTDAEQALWLSSLDNSPSTSAAVNESWGVLGLGNLSSSFQPYPATMQASAAASNYSYAYDPPPAFLPPLYATFPKPVPNYPGTRYPPSNTGYPHLPSHQ